MESKKIYEVDKVFPIRSRNIVIAHMNEREWNMKDEHTCVLVCKDRTFAVKYIGFGNMNSQLTLMLTPVTEDMDDTTDSIFDYFENTHDAMYLEF